MTEEHNIQMHWWRETESQTVWFTSLEFYVCAKFNHVVIY